MTWHLACNHKKFVNKIDAIKEHISSHAPLTFETPSTYDSFDFTKRTDQTLEELCVQKAKNIRDTHNQVKLWYSGGCDSHFILKTFLDNNIKIDELVLVKSGFPTADFEVDDYAIPFAKTTGIKFTVRQPDKDYYRKYYIDSQPMLGTANSLWHHFRLNNHFENLEHCDTDGVANIFGKEKPTLCFLDGKWYVYFLDVDLTIQPNQINFYIDDPIMHSKQCHMLINEIQAFKNQNDYNHITHFNEHQDFWNKSIGRYKDGNFPLKELSVGQHFNNKDQLAIQEAPQELVTAWKNKNNDLVRTLGENWFNNGNPALGTVGVFSKFYGITENTVKTVDELFPNGYKI